MPRKPDLPHFLVERLIRPLGAGSVVAAGWRVRRAVVSEDGQSIEYTLSPPEVQVVLEPRDDGAPALARTARFNVFYRSEERTELGAEVQTALREIVKLLTRNDLEAAAEAVTEQAPPATRVASSASGVPTLYLVPGHLSNDRDIGSRAQFALASSKNIFIEQDKEAATGALFDQLGIARADKQIVAIPHDPTQVSRPVARFRDAVERGEDCCLFGLDDGVPAFCDPGREIVLEAARLAGRVRIQSIGGPSALGTALMRAESEIESFVFAGILQYDSDLDAFPARFTAAAAARLPVVFYGMGGRLKTMLPALVERMPELKGRLSLYCDLTSDRETSSHVEIPGALPVLRFDDYARVIVIFTPAPISYDRNPVDR